MNIILTGGSSGLGTALIVALKESGHRIGNYDIEYGNDVRNPNISDIAEFASFERGGVDCLINCAAVNHIDWLENFDETRWDEVMDVNAKGIYMMSRACLPYLIYSKGTILNIVSNASHMPMTASLAYNASKAAAHIMTRQMARELTKKHGITVFGVAPNKMRDTGMSRSIDYQVVKTRGWTKEYAQEYQLKGLLTGEETPPVQVAEFIAFLLSSKDRHKYLSGTVIPYGA